MSECIFCKIIDKEKPADIIFENDHIVAFEDIKPVAPVHLLIVPKKHIISVNHLQKQDRQLIGEMFLSARKLALEKQINQSGYRLIFNIGPDAGQTVDHLHLHLIGGKKLLWA